MLLNFNIENMVHKEFVPSPEKKKKGWSYSFIYYLKDIKTIYNIYNNEKQPISNSQLLTICQERNIKSESGKAWTNRNLLEIVNALKNFDLIDVFTNTVKAGNIFSVATTELTNKDKAVFEKIYKSYFRFSDFHRLFASIDGNQTLIYTFKEGQRFFNRFVCIDKNELYYIKNTHQDTMRYWDVYTKWGETLGLLNKCPLASFNIQINNPNCKNIYVCNLTRPIPKNFSVCNYVKERMNGTAYYIPNIEWSLIKEYGFSIEEIKKCILDECTSNNSPFRLQRASFLTVDPEEQKLFPVIGNTYMSHILNLS